MLLDATYFSEFWSFPENKIISGKNLNLLWDNQNLQTDEAIQAAVSKQPGYLWQFPRFAYFSWLCY